MLKVKLPTFSGEILEWWDFRQTFQPLLEREHGLADAEKIAHLLSSMQGAEALSEAKITARSYNLYKKVVDHLKKKYDQPKIVYRHHVRKLCKQKTVSYTRQSLLNTLSLLIVHVNGLERHKGNTLKQYLTAQVELSMTDEVRCK